MTDRVNYYKTVFLGVIIGFCVCAMAALNFTSNVEEEKQTEGNFEVVDTYKGCDVVRWTNGNLAEYKYFLHCNNTRPVYGK